MRRPAAIGHSLRTRAFRARAICAAKLGAVMTTTAILAGACADVPIFHEPAKFAGFATTPKDGPDFVRDSRPAKTEFTSVGIETAKQPDKPRDAAGVKQLQAELEAQRDAGHAILQTLAPPAAAAAPAPQTPEDKIKAKAAKKAKAKDDADAGKPGSQAGSGAQAPQ